MFGRVDGSYHRFPPLRAGCVLVGNTASLLVRFDFRHGTKPPQGRAPICDVGQLVLPMPELLGDVHFAEELGHDVGQLDLAGVLAHGLGDFPRHQDCTREWRALEELAPGQEHYCPIIQKLTDLRVREPSLAPIYNNHVVAVQLGLYSCLSQHLRAHRWKWIPSIGLGALNTVDHDNLVGLLCVKDGPCAFFGRIQERALGISKFDCGCRNLGAEVSGGFAGGTVVECPSQGGEVVEVLASGGLDDTPANLFFRRNHGPHLLGFRLELLGEGQGHKLSVGATRAENYRRGGWQIKGVADSFPEVSHHIVEVAGRGSRGNVFDKVRRFQERLHHVLGDGRAGARRPDDGPWRSWEWSRVVHVPSSGGVEGGAVIAVGHQDVFGEGGDGARREGGRKIRDGTRETPGRGLAGRRALKGVGEPRRVR
mmetsp:Transcript_10385/g.29655  ORF Transcript_10385/g.29655 Transcript_10385/m.29655 type:complete len:424 (+) Transcript_10385:487-1758(+)